MGILLLPVLIAVVALPVAWLVSEIRSSKRSIRCTLGILTILSCSGAAWLATEYIQLTYNAWYGSAAKALIDASIQKLEAGEAQTVLRELKAMQERYHPTYESRADFDELARETADRIKAEAPASKLLQKPSEEAPDKRESNP